MTEPQSWLEPTAAKSSARRRIAGRIAAGLAVIAVVLGVYAYGPATAERKTAAMEPVKVAQAPTQDIQKLIPVPEPANVPPLTAADVKPASPASDDKKIQALIPEPQPANVAPLTAADFEKSATTASVPAVQPAPAKEASTPAAPAPAAAPAQTAAPATDSAPQMSAEEIKKLTGKDLVKAPIASSLAVADRGIAESIRDTLATRLDRIMDRREDRVATEIFYRDRGFAPLWIENGTRTARANSAIKHLEGITADGLDPADYPVPGFTAADAKSLAEAELRFTNSILDYARHAQTGRVHFSRMSGDVHYDLKLPEPAETLAQMAAATDVAPALAAFNPPHEGYKLLKAKLAEARGDAPEKQIVRVPEGPSLKPGMSDPRVLALRKRLEMPGDSDRYDDELAKAVLEFQRGAGLAADGIAGPATIARLNGKTRGSRTDAILATMERWRWMPRDLGRNYSMLNIPDFTLRVMKEGKPFWTTRVVVGKNNTKTPLISDTMKFITVNPTWNVPPSIIANEYLPALAQDPSVLDRMGLRLEENRDGTVRIYQPPGDSNALGRVRFNFPNKFLVYQHDTPDKNLFSRDVRAFSHGCMRVQDPVKYAEVVLSLGVPGENYTADRIRGMFGPSEQNINFTRPLPVHITYQTAYVDASGALVIRDDIYGHDAALMSVLKGERRVADVPMVRRQASFSREELRLPNGTYYGAYDGYSRGAYGRNPVEDFFRSIFR